MVDKSDIDRIRIKYPDRIPIYVTKSAYSMNDTIPVIDRNKFLAPDDITIAQFMHVIRRRIRLKPEQAIFLYVNFFIANPGLTLGEAYHRHKSTDGLLRLTYSSENAFGGGHQHEVLPPPAPCTLKTLIL